MEKLNIKNNVKTHLKEEQQNILALAEKINEIIDWINSKKDQLL